MTKYLNGKDLADFIKVRQLIQVRSLRQSKKIIPKLLIIINSDSQVINTYVNLKKIYGEDIGVEVEVKNVPNDYQLLTKEIKSANDDSSVHGIIVQLPIFDTSKTDSAIKLINPKKDVDGLTGEKSFDSATAVAINWLLTGYNIDLKNKDIAIVGAGRLVGSPLYKMWSKSNIKADLYDKDTKDLQEKLICKDIVITGVGKPGLIKPTMIKHGATIVDAGAASEGGVIKGDVEPSVYDRQDITITPKIGGVGPLTVAALFDHVIQAASTSGN